MLQKLLLILIPLLFSVSIDDNLIDWSSSRKLTWKDFEGNPDPASSNAALTSSSINVEFGYNGKWLTHTIKCRFNKKLSWGRLKNDYILNHEQHHFDIAEIHARILHKELLDYTFNAKTVNADVNRIYNNVMDEHVKMQQNYDNETDHSRDSTSQSAWDKKVIGLLKEYEKYADYK